MDNIDTVIIERLGERQRKVDFIARNIDDIKSKRFSWGKTAYTIMSVAACFALIVAVTTILFRSDSISDMDVAVPSFEEYRGAGCDEIERLINTGDYEIALAKVESELKGCGSEFETIESEGGSDEEIEYMKALYAEGRDELIWCKIYLLVKLDKKSELKIACRNYLEDGELTVHKIEVEQILEKIK